MPYGVISNMTYKKPKRKQIKVSNPEDEYVETNS